MSKLIEKILDEDHAKIITGGNLNDISNLPVWIGGDVPQEVIDFIQNIPTNKRVVVIISDEEPVNSDQYFSLPNGSFLSFKYVN